MITFEQHKMPISGTISTALLKIILLENPTLENLCCKFQVSVSVICLCNDHDMQIDSCHIHLTLVTA